MKVVVGASLLGLALALPTAPALTLLGSDEPTTVTTQEGPSETPVETPGEPGPEATNESEPEVTDTPEAELTDPEVADEPDPEDAVADADEPDAEEPARSDKYTAKNEAEDDQRSDEMTALAREHQQGMRAWKACVRAFKPTRSKGEHPHGNCTKPTPPGHLKNDRPWHGGTTKKSAGKAEHAKAPAGEKSPKAETPKTKPPEPDKAPPKR